MRRAFVLGAGLLGGCGIFSGLDSLGIDGGLDSASADGSDAVVDAVTDGAPETSLEASLEASSGPCPYTLGNPGCFGATQCENATDCCLTDAGGACAINCGNTGIDLACRDPDKCTVDGGHCCLEFLAGTPTAACPAIIPTNLVLVSSTRSVCVTSNCTDVNETRICTANGDCPQSAPHCRQAAFDIDPQGLLGICMPN
jgi:hypothetical protein